MIQYRSTTKKIKRSVYIRRNRDTRSRVPVPKNKEKEKQRKKRNKRTNAGIKIPV
jgi:hypothetical protein